MSSLEDLLEGAFRLARSRGGDSEGLRLAERACGRVSGEADGLGDCLEARDLGLTSGSGEDECERLEPCNLGALAGGGEADAERLVLRTGEADAACADFRLLGLQEKQDKTQQKGMINNPYNPFPNLMKQLFSKYCKKNLFFKVFYHIMTHRGRASVNFFSGFKIDFLAFYSQKEYSFSMTFQVFQVA